MSSTQALRLVGYMVVASAVFYIQNRLWTNVPLWVAEQWFHAIYGANDDDDGWFYWFADVRHSLFNWLFYCHVTAAILWNISTLISLR